MRGTSGAASPGSSAACIALAAAQAVRGTQIEISPWVTGLGLGVGVGVGLS